MPDAMAARMTVSELSPMSLTGRRFVPMKHPVSNWTALASSSPIYKAPNAI